MKIINGILQGVPFIKSPNHGGTITPKFITCHYTAGWTAASAISTLTNPSAQVSAQFVIDRDGSITQLVSCEQRAWHAGPSAFMGYKDLNTHAIGLEFVNPGYIKRSGSGYVDSTGKAIPAARLQGYDLSLEQAHPRLGGGKVVWPAYTKAQLDAGRELLKAICDAYNILGVCSHEEIDTRGWKTDPGPNFPIGEFKTLADRYEGRAAGGPSPSPTARATVTASALNGREQPSTSAPIVALLHANDNVTILEDRGDWCLVSGGKLARPVWVADKYLKHAA